MDGRYRRRSHDAVDDENFALSLCFLGLVPDQVDRATIRSIAGLIAGDYSIWLEGGSLSPCRSLQSDSRGPADGLDQEVRPGQASSVLLGLSAAFEAIAVRLQKTCMAQRQCRQNSSIQAMTIAALPTIV